MTILEAALFEVTGLLDELHLDHMLIGGMAVALWGEPRLTLDVDLTIWVEPDRFESTLELLAERFQVRTVERLETARRARVLSVRAANGVLVDLLFASWPIEMQAIESAAVYTISGKPVRVAALDYLLFLKLISERPKDLDDAAKLLRRHRNTANLVWLERELGALAESTVQPDILERFRRLLRDE